MAGVTRWYAVGVVERPGKPGTPPRYDTVYQERQGATPLTRAQIQALHAAEGGFPAFTRAVPPWTNPTIPATGAEDGPQPAPDGPFVAAAAGAVAGGLWAVFVAVLPFVFLDC